ncbi:MAG TPA: hypothetical protein VGL65_09965 [Gemmatimonadales bacterium]|jgi:hypothetical protein
MVGRIVMTLGLVVSVTAVAEGQALGIPVVNNGAPTGLTIGADVGLPNDDYGGGTAVAGRAALGLGFFGVSGEISHYSPKNGDGVWSPAAAATLRLLGGPLVPFRITLQGGVGHWAFGDEHFTHVPVSVGFAATIPNPAFAIKPWIAPRLDMVHSDVSGTSTEFGFSGGIDLSLLNGMTVRAAYDHVSNDGVSLSIISLGLGFAP